jgi:hypothetical protein
MSYLSPVERERHSHGLTDAGPATVCKKSWPTSSAASSFCSSVPFASKVGIAYGSNVEQALQILSDVVRAHPRTLREPAPLIVFETKGVREE